MSGHPKDVHLESANDIDLAQRDGVESEEVGGQQPGGLSAQEGPPSGVRRRGAGPSRAAARIRRIVPAPTRCPRPRSSPWIRRWPQEGFSCARRSTRALISSSIGGRPER